MDLVLGCRRARPETAFLSRAVKRIYRKREKDYITQCFKGRASFIRCPATSAVELRIRRPFLHLEIQFTRGKNFSLDADIWVKKKSTANRKKIRLTFSSSVSRLVVKKTFAQMPIDLFPFLAAPSGDFEYEHGDSSNVGNIDGVKDNDTPWVHAFVDFAAITNALYGDKDRYHFDCITALQINSTAALRRIYATMSAKPEMSPLGNRGEYIGAVKQGTYSMPWEAAVTLPLLDIATVDRTSALYASTSLGSASDASSTLFTSPVKDLSTPQRNKLEGNVSSSVQVDESGVSVDTSASDKKCTQNKVAEVPSEVETSDATLNSQIGGDTQNHASSVTLHQEIQSSKQVNVSHFNPWTSENRSFRHRMNAMHPSSGSKEPNDLFDHNSNHPSFDERIAQLPYDQELNDNLLAEPSVPTGSDSISNIDKIVKEMNAESMEDKHKREAGIDIDPENALASSQSVLDEIEAQQRKIAQIIDQSIDVDLVDTMLVSSNTIRDSQHLIDDAAVLETAHTNIVSQTEGLDSRLDHLDRTNDARKEANPNLFYDKEASDKVELERDTSRECVGVQEQTASKISPSGSKITSHLGNVTEHLYPDHPAFSIHHTFKDAGKRNLPDFDRLAYSPTLNCMLDTQTGQQYALRLFMEAAPSK